MTYCSFNKCCARRFMNTRRGSLSTVVRKNGKLTTPFSCYCYKSYKLHQIIFTARSFFPQQHWEGNDEDADSDIAVQECLIDLKSDVTDKSIFTNARLNFWIKTDIVDTFPQSCDMVILFVLAFSTSCLAECGFSQELHLLSKAL